MDKSFKFDLRQKVQIIVSYEIGTVRARGDGVDRPNQYLVEYVNGQNTATEAWWSEDQLRALDTITQSEASPTFAAEARERAEALQTPPTERTLQGGPNWLITPAGMMFIKDASVTSAALTELFEGLQASRHQQA